MRRLLVILLSVVTFGIHAQDLHTPKEIFEILKESSLTYMVEISNFENIPEDRKDNLNINDYYRVSGPEGEKIHMYDKTEETEDLLKRANENYNRKIYSDARKIYEQILEIDPNYFLMMTYIGQTYEAENNHKVAKEWYLKSIEKNYIDFLAHWLLAEQYYIDGMLDEAVSEITIAKILDRNNPRIDKFMKKIYSAKKLTFQNWTFNPHCHVEKKNEKEVLISSDDTWLGYGMVKAAWKFEPGYRESMGSNKEEFSFTEAKEGILALSIQFNPKTFKNYPDIKALNFAIENKMTEAYILYEILLPDYPGAVRNFSEESIESIKEYILLVRGSLM